MTSLPANIPVGSVAAIAYRIRNVYPKSRIRNTDCRYCTLANKEKKPNMPFYSDMMRGQELVPGVGVDSSVKPSLVLHPVFRGFRLTIITRSTNLIFS
jgi:hypothetical protein